MCAASALGPSGGGKWPPSGWRRNAFCPERRAAFSGSLREKRGQLLSLNGSGLGQAAVGGNSNLKPCDDFAAMENRLRTNAADRRRQRDGRGNNGRLADRGFEIEWSAGGIEKKASTRLELSAGRNDCRLRGEFQMLQAQIIFPYPSMRALAVAGVFAVFVIVLFGFTTGRPINT